jgi:3-oxoacyl-(acyl-carrier-protein) synthase
MSPHGVITGTGAVCPLGRTSEDFYRRLLAGDSGIRPMTAEERGTLQATHVALCDGFTPQPEIPPMKARRFDRGSQFAIVACAGALARAGYDAGRDPEAIGIAIGTGSAGAGALTEFLRVLLSESPEAAPPFHFANTVANAPASQVSIELKLHGPNVTVTQKDPSALNALLFATLALASGKARAMLVGGVDEWNPIYALGFDRVSALRGEKRCSGIVQGEGAFALLLEDEASARRRGARPPRAPARYRPGGSADGALPFRSRSGRDGGAVRGALEDAGVPPEGIGLWLPSRDGVAEMDAAELSAMRGVFGSPPPELLVKPAIGEMAAAGAGARRRMPGPRRPDGPLRRRPPAAPRPGELLRRRRQFPRGRARGRARGDCAMNRGRPEVAPLSGSTIEIPVRFAECDAYGVVWHGHYALYFEQAREALTAQHGFTASRALGLGYKVPITRMEIRYRQPILADDRSRDRAPAPSGRGAAVLDYGVRDTADAYSRPRRPSGSS